MDISVLDIIKNTLLALLPIMNPLATTPYFMKLTRHLETKKKYKLIFIVFIISCILLIMTFLLGKFTLEIFGLPIEFIKLGGGMVISYAGWKILYSSADDNEIVPQEMPSEIVLSPLTLPVTVSIGAIAIMMTFSVDTFTTTPISAYNIAGVIIGMLIVMTIIITFFRFSDYIFVKILRKQGTQISEKLSGFLMFSYGLLTTWNGLSGLIINYFYLV